MRRGKNGRSWLIAGAMMVIGLASRGQATVASSDAVPGVTALRLQRDRTLGGLPVPATVTLASPAPAAGVTVTLSSDSPAAQVPPAVLVPPGAARASFTVATTPVAAITTAMLSASAGGAAQTARLAVNPPFLYDFSLAPATVAGGQDSTGTVMLSSAAPAGGLLIPLSVRPPDSVRLPRAVIVPEGAREVSFSVETPVVAVDTSVQITAGSPDNARTRTLALLSPDLTVGPGTVFALPLVTHDMVYDPHRLRIYASLPAGPDGVAGIAVVDPSRGVIVDTVPTAAELYHLALSDDGHYLYAAPYQGDGPTPVIWRLGLPSFTTDLQFQLPIDPVLRTFLEDFQVAPGQPRSLAVLTSLQSIPGEYHLALYDDDRPRPLDAILHGQNYVMQFAGSGSRMYAYGLGDYVYGPAYTGFILERLRVSTDGVTMEGIIHDVITGQGTDMRYDSGRLYTTSGRVVDPEAGRFLGRFPALLDFGDLGGNDAYSRDLVLPDAAAGRVYYLVMEGPDAKLRAYDPATFQLIGEQKIPDVRFTPSRLLRWGEDGLAFRTDLDQLFLIRPALGPPSDLVLVQPTSVVGGSPAAGTVILPAPAPAAGTMVYLSSSDPAAAVPASLIVAVGENSATFPITTRPVTVATDVVVQAAYGTIRTTHLLVLPAK